MSVEMVDAPVTAVLGPQWYVQQAIRRYKRQHHPNSDVYPILLPLLEEIECKYMELDVYSLQDVVANLCDVLYNMMEIGDMQVYASDMIVYQTLGRYVTCGNWKYKDLHDPLIDPLLQDPWNPKVALEIKKVHDKYVLLESFLGKTTTQSQFRRAMTLVDIHDSILESKVEEWKEDGKFVTYHCLLNMSRLGICAMAYLFADRNPRPENRSRIRLAPFSSNILPSYSELPHARNFHMNLRMFIDFDVDLEEDVLIETYKFYQMSSPTKILIK